MEKKIRTSKLFLCDVWLLSLIRFKLIFDGSLLDEKKKGNEKGKSERIALSPTGSLNTPN